MDEIDLGADGTIDEVVHYEWLPGSDTVRATSSTGALTEYILRCDSTHVHPAQGGLPAGRRNEAADGCADASGARGRGPAPRSVLRPRWAGSAGQDAAHRVGNVDYVRTHATELHVDPERIALWYFSGGGPQLSWALRERPSFVRCVQRDARSRQSSQGTPHLRRAGRRRADARDHHPGDRLRSDPPWIRVRR